MNLNLKITPNFETFTRYSGVDGRFSMVGLKLILLIMKKKENLGAKSRKTRSHKAIV